MKLKVGVIFGGKSVEHDISIISAMQVIAALDKELYEVQSIYMNKENRFFVGPDFDKIETFRNEELRNATEILFFKKNNLFCFSRLKKIKRNPVTLDVLIPVVHGAGVEDGTLVGFLDVFGVPYVGSNLTSSAIAQDKVFTKQIYQEQGINVLKGRGLKKTEFDYEQYNLRGLDYPIIVKPATLGSSIGIKVAKDEKELLDALKLAFMYDDKVLLEEALDSFREFNCAVLKDRHEYHTSAVEEVIRANDILSFSDKYESSKSKFSAAANRIIPAEIESELTSLIKSDALKAYKALSLKGIARVDFLYVEESGQLYVNEINTIPGSLSFYLMEKEGMNFSELLNILIKDAFYEKNHHDQLIHHFKSSVLNNKTTKLRK